MRRALLLTLIACGLATGCTETDDVVREVGTAAVVLADPGALPQSLDRPLRPIQASEWIIERAVLDLDGTSWDLTAGASCRQADTVFSVPLAEGPCRGGLIIDFVDTPRRVRLELTFTMDVSRARPVVLSALGDFDGDGIPNDGDLSGSPTDNPCRNGAVTACDDNCLLLANTTQDDPDNNGIGTACSVIDPFTGAPLLDSDGDGVADSTDNCIWVANPGQEDSEGPLGNILDGIGDACQAQRARVRVAGGGTVVALDLGPLDLDQLANRPNLLVVEINNLDALDCDWEAGFCQLDPAQVGFCIQPDLFTASLGCL